MSVANKTRALLNLTGHKTSDLSECLEKSVQSVRNKFSQDSFSIYDLIRICNYLNCEMIIKTQENQTISFSMDDLKK